MTTFIFCLTSFFSLLRKRNVDASVSPYPVRNYLVLSGEECSYNGHIVHALRAVRNYLVLSGEECSYNGHIVHALRPDDEGVITSPNYPDQYVRLQMVCDINLQACIDCVVEVKFVDFSFPVCGQEEGLKPSSTEVFCDYYQSCEYFVLKDGSGSLEIYDGNKTGTVYLTGGNSLQLRFCYSTFYNPQSPRKWMIRYKTIEKIPVYTSNENNGSVTLHSNGYPARYSASTKRYLLRNPDRNGRMVLLFDDLVLAHSSSLTIYDGPNEKSQSTLRRSFQRSMFTSSGPEVLLVFDPGPAQGEWIYQPGFKLRAEFDETKYSTHRFQRYFSTSIVDSLNQGYILFQTKPSRYAAYYDYVWYVRAPDGLRSFIKMDKFTWNSELRLEIRNGNNSQGRLVQTLDSQFNGWISQVGGFDSYTGFYLRLTGKSAVNDEFLLAVTAFTVKSSINFRDCELEYANRMDAGFYCVSDGRCIPVSRKCDSVNHCTDKTDENVYNCPNPVTLVYTMAPPVITTLTPCIKEPFTYRCEEDPNICIVATRKCDGHQDCPMASDEKYCRPSGESPPIKFGTDGYEDTSGLSSSGAGAASGGGGGTAWLYVLFALLLAMLVIFMVFYRRSKRRGAGHIDDDEGSRSNLTTQRVAVRRVISRRNGRHDETTSRPTTFVLDNNAIATIVTSRDGARFSRRETSPNALRHSCDATENLYEQIGSQRDSGSYRDLRIGSVPSYDEVLLSSGADDSFMTQESMPSYDEVRELIPSDRRSRLGSRGTDNTSPVV